MSDHNGKEDLKNYYNAVFSEERGISWEDAPGKCVIVQALRSYLCAGIITKKAKIVEIGCGTGRLLSRIKNEVLPNKFDLYGVDFSDEAVLLCKKKHKYIEIFCEDGAGTHFSNQTFDVIISYGAYEHFNSPKKAIQELARILKKGGVFLCMLPTLGIYRTDRTDEGWYEDLSPNTRISSQMQWNLLRSTWELYFEKAKLVLHPVDEAERYGAQKAGVFYFGEKLKSESSTT